MMTELDEPFSRVDGDFKSYVEKSIPIRGLLTIKATESMVYDVERSYK